MQSTYSNPTIDQLKLSSQNWLLRKIILPIGDMAFGQKMMRRLEFLEEAQWWPLERLRNHRDRALRNLIQIAYRETRFYRDLLDSAGMKPADFRSADDLRKLPVVTKEMLRAAYPLGVTRHTGSKSYETSSSGSTGKNFYVLEDYETAGWYRASFMLALEWSGWRVGEPQLQTGMTLKRDLPRRLKDLMLRCHYVSAFDLSDAKLDAALEILDKEDLDYLWGYPGSLYYLSRRAIAVGWNRPLRSAVTWGDNLYPHYRRTIEQAFKTRVFDTYGCGEGMQIAAQCGHATTYHVHSLDVITEYVDYMGHPIPPGEPGNMIVTRLHPGPMPLIRYRIGDICVSGANRVCDCGRSFEVMESVQGRDTDVVITPEGNRLIVHFFTGILEHFHEVESFQIVQEDRESLLVRVVPGRQFSSETAHRITETLEERGARGLKIEVISVAEIPLPPSGKRRFVISHVVPEIEQKTPVQR